MGHTSVLEHSVVFVRTHTPETYMEMISLLTEYVEDTGYPHYIRYTRWEQDAQEEFRNTIYGNCFGKEHLFSGNIRAWRNVIAKYPGEYIFYDVFHSHPAFADLFEGIDEWNDDELQYTKDKIEIVDSIPFSPDEFEYSYRHNIVTLRIVADRGVIDEFARHRAFGHSIESTRYCNYSKAGTTFVFPYWFVNTRTDPKITAISGRFASICYDTEVAYQELMRITGTPQLARGSLNLWVKSEQVMTGTVEQWIDFLKLRDSAAAHPEAQKIAKMIETVLVEEVGVKDMWGVTKNAD